MRKLILILAPLCLMLAVWHGWAAEEGPKTVVAKGEAAIFNNDKAAAKDRAVEAALRNAVEQVVGVFIQSSTLVQNYVAVEDKVLSQSKGYVKSWEIVSERVEDGVMIVEVKATVASAEVKGDLDKIQWVMAQKEYPRVMMLIAEQNVGQTGFSYWWGNTTSVVSMGVVENTLQDELSKLGFTFVDPQVLTGKLSQKGAFQITSAGVSDQQAREIADLTDAQVVIVGTAVAIDAGATTLSPNSHSGQADISLRVINSDNGEILLTSKAHDAHLHVSPVTAGNKALEKAAKKIAKDVSDRLVDKWMVSAHTVTLEVSGVTSYLQLDQFKRTLANEFRGVRAVRERKMIKNTAQFDLYYDSKTSNLAVEFEQRTFKGYKIKVIEVTANRIKVEMISDGK